jgi:hypothetical protein
MSTFSRYQDETNRRFLAGWQQRAYAQRAGRTDIGYGGEVRYRSSAWDQEMRSEVSVVRTPRTEMVARNDWPCKFEGCGDRTVVAGTTVIVKRDGKWGHKVCPVAVAVEVEPEAVVANLEIADDLEAQLTREYDELCRTRRVANIANLQVGTYRVEFSGRRDTDAFNLKITKDRRNEGAFYFKQAESYEGVGRIWADGRIQTWNNDLTAEQRQRAIDALEVLLSAERMGRYGEAYARATGACFRCGRELKVEDSIDRGLGSHCAKQVELGY